MNVLILAHSKGMEIVMSALAEDDNIEKITTEDISLKGFVKQQMLLYGQCDTIVINRMSLAETDTELAEIFQQMRLMYAKQRVVLVYPGINSTSPEFAKSLLRADITNIVSAEDEADQRDELIQCLSDEGMDELKWIRLYPDLLSNDDTKRKISLPKLKRKYVIMAASVVALCMIGLVVVSMINRDNKIAVDADAEVTTTTTITTTAPVTTTAPLVTTAPATTVAPTTTKAPVTTTSTSKETSKATTTKKATTTETKTTTQATTTSRYRYTNTTPATTTQQPVAQLPTALTRIVIYSLFKDNHVIISEEGQARVGAAITPAAADQSVRWVSNRPDLATVDSDGVITGISPGVAIITAISVADNDFTASCMVTVIADT